MKKLKKSGWVDISKKSDMEWMSQWIISGLAWEFYKKHKFWPTRINLESIMVKGRNISVEME